MQVDIDATKSPGDERNYRLVRLDNGMRVLLVSDTRVPLCDIETGMEVEQADEVESQGGDDSGDMPDAGVEGDPDDNGDAECMDGSRDEGSEGEESGSSLRAAAAFGRKCGDRETQGSRSTRIETGMRLCVTANECLVYKLAT